MANWEAFSRSVLCMGYSIPCVSKSFCAIAKEDCMADVPVLPCPICKKILDFDNVLFDFGLF